MVKQNIFEAPMRTINPPIISYFSGLFYPLPSPKLLPSLHITKRQLLLYIPTEIMGALLASLFVKYVIENDAFLGANLPNYAYPLHLIFGVETLASALLIVVILVVVILVVVYTRGLMRLRYCYWWDSLFGHIIFRVCVGRINESCHSLAPALMLGELKRP